MPEKGIEFEGGDRKRVIIFDFLSYHNPKDDEYQKLFPQGSYQESSDSFEARKLIGESHLAFLRSPGIADYLERKLEGQILVDCGGGREEYMKDLAVNDNSACYINIDKRLPDYSRIPLQTKIIDGFSVEIRSEELKGKTQIYGIGGDLLRTVARFPSGSSNFVINNIDDIIISNEKYWQALADEIARATRIGGVVMGFNASLPKYLDKNLFVATDLSKSANIYERK